MYGGISVVAMKPLGLAIAAAATLAISAGAFAARAEGAQTMLVSDSDFSAPTLNGAPTTTKRNLEWDDSKGRWGLNFGVEQHDATRDVQLKDVSSGVYYKLNKHLHIGGAVSLAPDQAETLRMGQPQVPAPRVRLEGVWKF
jgi:hypothetical protein